MAAGKMIAYLKEGWKQRDGAWPIAGNWKEDKQDEDIDKGALCSAGHAGFGAA